MICPFCLIVAGKAPATIVGDWHDAIAIVPLKPVTDGHVIVIPYKHVPTAVESPRLAGKVMAYAAEFAAALWVADPGVDFNLIYNVGPAATQTVPHLHAHIVPRRAGDGLALPWTGSHS